MATISPVLSPQPVTSMGLPSGSGNTRSVSSASELPLALLRAERAFRLFPLGCCVGNSETILHDFTFSKRPCFFDTRAPLCRRSSDPHEKPNSSIAGLSVARKDKVWIEPKNRLVRRFFVNRVSKRSCIYSVQAVSISYVPRKNDAAISSTIPAQSIPYSSIARSSDGTPQAVPSS